MAIELPNGDLDVTEEGVGLRWQLRLFGRTEPINLRDPDDLARAAAGIILEKRGEATRSPLAADYTYTLHAVDSDAAVEPEILRAERWLLLDLASGGAITMPVRNQRSREFKLSPEVIVVAVERLTVAWLIRLEPSGTITASYPAEAPAIREWPADLAQRWINPLTGSAVPMAPVDRFAPPPAGLPLAGRLVNSRATPGGPGDGVFTDELSTRAACGPAAETTSSCMSVGMAHGGPPEMGDQVRDPVVDQVTLAGPADPLLWRAVRAILAALASGPLPQSTIRNRYLSAPQRNRMGEALTAAVAAGVITRSEQVRATVYLIHYNRKADVAADLDAVVDEVMAVAAVPAGEGTGGTLSALI